MCSTAEVKDSMSMERVPMWGPGALAVTVRTCSQVTFLAAGSQAETSEAEGKSHQRQEVDFVVLLDGTPEITHF